MAYSRPGKMKRPFNLRKAKNGKVSRGSKRLFIGYGKK